MIFVRLDTLICNAGLWVPMDRHCKTSDGFEIHAGNYYCEYREMKGGGVKVKGK